MPANEVTNLADLQKLIGGLQQGAAPAPTPAPQGDGGWTELSPQDISSFINAEQQGVSPIGVIEASGYGAHAFMPYASYMDELAAMLSEPRGGLEALKRLVGAEYSQEALDPYEAAKRAYEQRSIQAQTEQPLAFYGAGVPGMAVSSLLPVGGATRLGRLGVTLGEGAIAGAGASEGAEDLLSSAVQGAGISSVLPVAGATVSGAKKVAKSSVPVLGRIFTGMPADFTRRYMERGPAMDKTDSLEKIAEEIPGSLNELLKQTRERSWQSRDILKKEGVRVPREEVILALRNVASKSDRSNESNAAVINAIQNMIDELTPTPGSMQTVRRGGAQSIIEPTSTRTVVGGGVGPSTPGARTPMEELLIQGAEQRTVPTSTRTVVGGGPTPGAPARGGYGGIPISEARGTPPRAPQTITEMNIPGVRPGVAPSMGEVVVTEPGYTPPNLVEGGRVKDFVQRLDDILRSLRAQGAGYKSSAGFRTGSEARGALDKFLKEGPYGSPAYAKEMEEVSKRMNVLERGRKQYATPQAAINKMRAIGWEQPTATFRAKDLQDLSEMMGEDYVNRIKDQIVLDAFTKAGVQGSRGVQIGKALGGALPVGAEMAERAGAVAGAAADYYSRALLKRGIDTGRWIKNLVPKLPLKYQKVFNSVATRGPNVIALTHDTLLREDPEYAQVVSDIDAGNQLP